MKYLKILAAALATVTFASCSDDDNKQQTNTASGVTVCMENAQMRFREKSGLVTVPVTVQGESNGYITVTITCTEYGQEPAMDDVHYYMTSKTINIEPGATSGCFELSTVDDSEINEDRMFVVSIVECKGAEIGNPKDCTITLRDDDSDPYYLVSGPWKCPSFDYDGNPQTLTVNFKAYDEGESGYYTYYDVEGLGIVPVRAEFAYDQFGGTGTVSFTYGQEGKYKYNGEDKSTLFAYLSGNSIGDVGTAVFTWNDTYTELTLQSGPQGDFADFVVLMYDDGWYLMTPLAMNVVKFTR